MHDGAGRVFPQQFGDQRAVADVAVNERVPRVVADRVQRVEIAGVGERVEVQQPPPFDAQPVAHEGAADEPGSAGDENHVAHVVPTP